MARRSGRMAIHTKINDTAIMAVRSNLKIIVVPNSPECEVLMRITDAGQAQISEALPWSSRPSSHSWERSQRAVNSQSNIGPCATCCHTACYDKPGSAAGAGINKGSCTGF